MYSYSGIGSIERTLIFIFMQIKTYFNKKRFALGLISKVRVFGLWNWPIQLWLERSCTMRAFDTEQQEV